MCCLQTDKGPLGEFVIDLTEASSHLTSKAFGKLIEVLRVLLRKISYTLLSASFD